MIQPLGKNIVARIEQTDTRRTSGIYVPENSSVIVLDPKTATILEVGDEVTKVKKNQKIVFKPFAPYEVKDNESEVVIIEEEDILGIVK